MQDIFNAIGVLDLNWGVWKLFLRVFLAIIAGFILGLESRSRAKDAGVKTHTFLCVTACVLMIISKYGFYELAKFEGIQYPCFKGCFNNYFRFMLCWCGNGVL